VCKSPSDTAHAEASYDDSMPGLLDMNNTLAEDEDDEYDTFGHTKTWDYHDHARIKAESEIMELADEVLWNI
jgi:hypothetical protein